MSRFLDISEAVSRLDLGPEDNPRRSWDLKTARTFDLVTLERERHWPRCGKWSLNFITLPPTKDPPFQPKGEVITRKLGFWLRKWILALSKNYPHDYTQCLRIMYWDNRLWRKLQYFQIDEEKYPWKMMRFSNVSRLSMRHYHLNTRSSV